MTDTLERSEASKPLAEVSDAVEAHSSTKTEQPTSPARSDKSSDSERQNVREKLKETRIDARPTSDPAPSSDQPMNDAPNGVQGDNSTSGSESERGRLRRKRSREEFDDEQEEAKHPEKKHERQQERHTRKKSRDITSPRDADTPTLVSKPIPKIDEHVEDENMAPVDEPAQPEISTVERQSTPEAANSNKEVTMASPNNKRTRDQVEAGAEARIEPAAELIDSTVADVKAEEERDTKRPRDEVNSQRASQETEGTTKISLTSGFSNTSAVSPFATMSAKPQTSSKTDASAEALAQTSDDKFKKSGFSSFSSSSASPFGGLAATGSSSPFGAAGGKKLTSFASSTTTATAAPSGFAAIGGSSGSSAFGSVSAGSKPVFGGTLGKSGFGNLGDSKLPSFGSGAAITGLSQPRAAFGASDDQHDKEDDEEAGSDKEEDGAADHDAENAEGRSEQDRRPSQPILQPQGPLETGEEGEDTIWTGRAKLYTLVGESGKKQWHERGMGNLKLNQTQDTPRKARFVLRADGTHRLLLNAAVTKNLTFGNSNGEEPKDGKILFTAPSANGELETHTLKLKIERAIDLYHTVSDLKLSL